MKKHKCPICFRHKSNMNVIIPCMHLVCFNCLSVWVSESGQICPYCRSKFDRACSCDKDGKVKSEINTRKKFSYDVSNFHPPRGTTPWKKELQRKWPQILDRVCNCLYEIDVYDNTILSYIIKTISDNSKEEANNQINSFLGELYPNMVNSIFSITFQMTQKEITIDQIEDQFL